MNSLRRNRFFIFLFGFMFFTACNEKIPVKEMATARHEITRALSVKADKYAPEELEAAKKKLLESHELVKTDKLPESQTAAVDSYKKANEAYEKALPLLAKDAIDTAEKSVESADEAYARVLAEEEFTKAGNSMVKANEQFEQKKYLDSYQSGLDADAQAIEAKNIALSKKNLLAEAITEVKTTIDDANKYNASKHAPEKLSSAGENVKAGEEALGALTLKKGFAAIEAAKMDADEAYQKALEGTAKEKLEETKTAFGKAETSEGAAAVPTELNGAREAMLLAESLLAESKLKESISASEESLRLSAVVINSKKQVEVAVTDKDANPKTKVKEKIPAEQGEQEIEYIIYKVKYNPQRRDCLWRISGKFYTTPGKWKSIFDANKDKIKNPDLIWPDMLLKVPNPSKKGIGEEKPQAIEAPASEPVKAEPPADNKNKEPEMALPATESKNTESEKAEPAIDNKDTEPEKIEPAIENKDTEAEMAEPASENTDTEAPADESAPAEVTK